MKRVPLSLLLVASAAHADDDAHARADAVYKEGEQLYADKQYLAAAARFEASYAIEADPAVLFNIAQAYRLGRACAQAARFYHQFIDKVPSPPDRDKLDRYITEMDACAKAEAAATQPTVIHDTRVVHDTQVVHVADHPSRVLPLALGAGGLLSLGIAAYFTYDVHQIQRDREAACPPGCLYGDVLPRLQHLDDRGHRAEIGEVVFYAVGGAAVIASAVLFVLDHRAPADRVVTVAPLPGGGSVAASWRF